MSAAVSQKQVHTDVVLENPKATRLYNYLNQKLNDTAELYIKSKFIADDVDMSTKELGALFSQLQDAQDELKIEPWSYTGATTWRVTEA